MWQGIFITFAVVLTLGAVVLLAMSMRSGGDDKARQWARTAETVAALQGAYQRAVKRRAAGSLSEAAFAERENELAMRLVQEIRPEADVDRRESRKAGVAALAAIVVMVPATTAGLYMRYGDFSSMDARALAQIAATREAFTAEKTMAESIETLKRAVEKDPDNLQAWEILADHYAVTEHLAEAEMAFENVVRLDPKNARAYGELVDLQVALQDGNLGGEIPALIKKALALDPYQEKTLLVAGVLAIQEGRPKDAVIYWRRLRARMPDDEQMAPFLDANIDAAMKAAGLTEPPLDPVAPNLKKAQKP